MSNSNDEVATPIHFCPIDMNLLHVTNTPYPDPNSMPAHMAEQEQRYTRHGQRLYRWYCLTCNFTYPINEAVRIEVDLNPKEVDDVLGGEGAWKYAAVEKNVHCEREGGTNKGTCLRGRRASRSLGLTTRTHARTHAGAYFREVQTRSADEAATLYFRCTACRYQWVHRG